MNTNLFFISSFWVYLMFSSEKHRNQLLNYWNNCSLLLASAYFFGQLLLILQSKFHFRLDSNQQFQGRFGFLLDQLSILWLLFVTGIGSLIHMYSISYMHDDENNKYFAYLNLFIFFMITLVIR
jgi:NADH-quinone oxidoreductase subunit L